MRLYDSHLHLQDPRLSAHLPQVLNEARSAGVILAVTNGTSPEDWPRVSALCRENRWILPSFGVHPWEVARCASNWRDALLRFLDERPAGLGEIGLDRWIENADVPMQEEFFIEQLRLAAERNVPASIHCLKAWGRLLELLQTERRPRCGFLLHSYGGPLEMVESFVKLGAYFSVSGYFAHPRKAKLQTVWRAIPAERLLIETDAPDMLPPLEFRRFALCPNDEDPPNHPANLGAVYEFVASVRHEPLAHLAAQVEANFQRLFGPILPEREGA